MTSSLLMMTSLQHKIYPHILKTFFPKKVGNTFSKHFLKQVYIFDVPYAIQDDLLLFRRTKSTSKLVGEIETE